MTVAEKNEIVRQVLAALERETRIDLRRYPIRVDFNDGILTLEGETGDISAKKIGLELAAAIPGVEGIVDRLWVAPAVTMEDGEIRDHTCDALMQEGAFHGYTIRVLVKDAWETVRQGPAEATGLVDVEVRDGLVVLNGRVGSLSHKRLAGVLAWWVPGSRDIVNGLEVDPPEEDNDDEVRDAVRLVLEKDPFVNASQIKVSCRDFEVTLEGVVPKPLERDMAEADAWYVFRVEKVFNMLEVVE
ncbi:MAG TPA: BON domain-containing protein [Geobacteraceae bacterium]|nr:BON domain-containing protein [Geobacteraceae bacterium]